MADLVRTRRAGDTGVRTRVIFVRDSVKDVRREHDRNLLPVRLAIGVITAVGILSAVCLMGHVGFHLGFAQAVGVPELAAPVAQGWAGGALIDGLRLLASLPEAVFAAALSQPAWLMLGFLLIAIPAASLAVIGPPPTPGGPRPHVLTVVFSHTGAIAGGVVAIALVWWTVLPFRIGRLEPMPTELLAFASWLSNMRIIAGLDVLSVVAAAVWMVLVMRLVVPRWLKGLCATAIFAALAVVTIALSVSAGTLSQMDKPRAVVGDAILIGELPPGRVVMMGRTDDEAVMSIEAPRHGRAQVSSIVDLLR